MPTRTGPSELRRAAGMSVRLSSSGERTRTCLRSKAIGHPRASAVSFGKSFACPSETLIPGPQRWRARVGRSESGQEQTPCANPRLSWLKITDRDRRPDRSPVRSCRAPAERPPAGPKIARQRRQPRRRGGKETPNLNIMSDVDAAIVDLHVETVGLVASRGPMLQRCEGDIIVDRRGGLEGRIRPVDLDVLAFPMASPNRRIERMRTFRHGLNSPGIKDVVTHVKVNKRTTHSIDGPFPDAPAVRSGSQQPARSVNLVIGQGDLGQALLPYRPAQSCVVGAEHANIAAAEQPVAVRRIDDDP